MCGVFGIISDEPITESIYHAIIQLQHRGQDAAGIFTYDPLTDKHAIHKDHGLVTQVFTTDTLPLINASWGIGHVRYPTIGKNQIEDTQPFYVHGKNTIAISHNGNVVNYVPLRRELESQGLHFESTCDAEVILHILSQNLESDCSFESICRAVLQVYRKVSGSYSVAAVIGGVGLVAFRDPAGLRPLLYGTRKNDHAFASENNALNVLGFENILEVFPGQVMFVDKAHSLHTKTLTNEKHAVCTFEYNYFSKPNTLIEGKEVYGVRKRLGEVLAKQVRESGIEIDAVVPIPTTSRPAAVALAKELGVNYEEGFVKQDNIGRTFIMPTQAIRQKALSRKLAAVRSVFNGKSILLVDDSIVRGTVSKRVIALARQAGAKKVYFASTFPPIRHPCLYGIDFPNKEQLAAYDRSIEEVCTLINADKLFYNDVKDLQKAVESNNICTACLTGKYPTCMKGMEELQHLRKTDLAKLDTACKK